MCLFSSTLIFEYYLNNIYLYINDAFRYFIFYFFQICTELVNFAFNDKVVI